ncbi:HNH endonuclease [Gemmatimonas sp.]|uniref:HNH endonuclease n=1 Tax=Gemmatimonas sp. TaxID=1962908 RepID=UPI0033423586
MDTATKIARWLSRFPKRKDAPPGGWHLYLREGWAASPSEWKARYRHYLASNAWTLRKAGVHRRADGKCEMCSASSRLDVHHVDYTRVGKEQVEDLRLLCRSCHGIQHATKRPPHLPLNAATKQRLRDRAEAKAWRDKSGVPHHPKERS